MKTIGLIGGLSWESTAIYYRLLNEGVRRRLGGLHSAEILLWSFDFARIEALQSRGDWTAAAAAMIEAARRLERGGAECLLIGSNTMHRMAGEIEAAVDLPLLHIADAAAAAIKASASRRPLLLATAYTMEQPFYKERLARGHGIDVMVPEPADRETVHRIIYEELCRGIVRPESRSAYLEAIGRARAKGADGVILGCTEVGMLIGASDLDLPVFDSAVLHVEAALDFAAGTSAEPGRAALRLARPML
jgi:aspartate racemase